MWVRVVGMVTVLNNIESILKPRMAPRRARTTPRRPQDGLRTAQDGPTTAQDSPKMAQDSPKAAQNASGQPRNVSFWLNKAANHVGGRRRAGQKTLFGYLVEHPK